MSRNDEDERAHASVVPLQVHAAVEAVALEESARRAARLSLALRFGLGLALVAMAGTCGLVCLSGGREANRVGARSAAYVELMSASAEYDCLHVSPSSLSEGARGACFGPARALGEEWDRDPTTPGWALLGDRVAREIGFTGGVIEVSGALSPELALRLVRGKLLMRHARGLPALADVTDPFDRRAILAENAPGLLFAEPDFARFFERAFDDDEAAPEALAVLFAERLRRDLELLSTTRVPSSSGNEGPAVTLARRFSEFRAIAALDDAATRAAARVVERAPTAAHPLAVRAYHARGDGPLAPVFAFPDDDALRVPSALARLLALRARALTDDDARALSAVRAARATSGARPTRGDQALDLFLTLSTTAARDEACARLLTLVAARGLNVDIAARPVLGCVPPSDLEARLAPPTDARGVAHLPWRADGSVRQGVATLFGVAFVPSGETVPDGEARDAAFHEAVGVRPLVFGRVKNGDGGFVAQPLSCDVERPCPDDAVQGDLRALRAFVRAEQ